MKVTKERLRQSARWALEKKGYSEIELAPGPGIIPGARLQAMKDGRPVRVAVRTSSDREAALLRTSGGKWRTIDKVDLILISVPVDDALSVDVFAFEPKILLEVFDDTAQAMEGNKRGDSHFKVPFSIPLDDVKNRKGEVLRLGLKRKAVWCVVLPLEEVPSQPVSFAQDGVKFFEHVRKQIADFIGVNVSKIDIEIRIKP